MTMLGTCCVLFVAVSVIIQVNYVDALLCLNCDAISNPKYCLHVTQCFAGEQCGMETYVDVDGDLVYKLGCMQPKTCSVQTNATVGGNQFVSCHECCDDEDLCNVAGCGSLGYPVQRGPICYNCENQLEGSLCHHITHCEQTEVCYDEVTEMFSSDRLVTSGCINKHHCPSTHVDPLVGKRDADTSIVKRTSHVCSDCCQGDLCNKQCENNNNNHCADDDSCETLMAGFNICSSPAIASLYCKKTCGLCTETNCVDTRVDCKVVHNSINICVSQSEAKSYGCLEYCGFCNKASTTSLPPTTTTTLPPTTTTTFPPTTTTTLPPTTITTFPPMTTTTLPPTTTTIPPTTTTEPPTTTLPLTAQTTRGLVTLPSVPINFTTEPLFVGDIVMPGPDWAWGNQNGNGTGVVVNNTKHGWVTVYWNNTKNEDIYRYGNKSSYDVQLVQVGHVTTPQPSTTPTTTINPLYVFQVGDKVVRGPDWRYGLQDGNGEGVVIDTTSTPGWVSVHWNITGYSDKYRNGEGGRYDVMKLTTTTTPTTVTTTTPTTVTTTAPPTAGPILLQDLYDGALVQRGKDWMYGTQDSNGHGEVLSIDKASGWVKIKWSSGYVNDYRVGADNSYDIQFVPNTYNPPSTMSP